MPIRPEITIPLLGNEYQARADFRAIDAFENKCQVAALRAGQEMGDYVPVKRALVLCMECIKSATDAGDALPSSLAITDAIEAEGMAGETFGALYAGYVQLMTHICMPATAPQSEDKGGDQAPGKPRKAKKAKKRAAKS